VAQLLLARPLPMQQTAGRPCSPTPSPAASRGAKTPQRCLCPGPLIDPRPASCPRPSTSVSSAVSRAVTFSASSGSGPRICRFPLNLASTSEQPPGFESIGWASMVRNCCRLRSMGSGHEDLVELVEPEL